MLSEGEEAGFTLVFQTAPRLLPTLNLPWPPETPQPGDRVPAQGRPKLSMLWSLSLAVKFLRLAAVTIAWPPHVIVWLFIDLTIR